MHAQRDFGFALDEIEPAVGHEEVHTQLGYFFAECLDHRGKQT
jgi:hypothetical protein